jgi:hypothetical protein
MIFKPEITLGTVIELAAFFVVVLGAVNKFGKIEQKVNTMYAWFEHTVLSGEFQSNQKQRREDRRNDPMYIRNRD